MAQLMGEFFDELIPAYIRESEKYIEQMPQAFVAGDIKTLERLAHSLKSSSRNVGADNFAGIAERLEKTARQGDVANCPPLMQAIAGAFAGVRTELERYQTAR